MDRQHMIERMITELQASAQRIGQQASPSRQDMAAMEHLIYQQMDAAKATLLQMWVDHATDDSQRPNCPHCQGRMRQKEQSPKTSACECLCRRAGHRRTHTLALPLLRQVFFSLWMKPRLWPAWR